MNQAVLDASVALRWILDDETDREGALRIREALVLGRLVALAPPSFLPEVGGALVRAVRGGRITADRAVAALEAVAVVGIDTPELVRYVRDAMRIALETGILLNDATYICAAASRGLPLVSADKAQLAAAARLGVAGVALSDVPPLEP